MPEHKTDDSACAGGMGGGGYHDDHTPPQSDCGVRDYDSTLQVTIPQPNTLYAAGDQVQIDHQLWSNCGDLLYPFEPVVAPWRDNCYGTPTIEGGELPSTAQIADPTVRHFQVEGSYSCLYSETGELSSSDYTWTLDFCRLTDGKPDC